MNANELADHMEKYFDSEPYCDEVVTMLRQQQAEIEALKKFKTEVDAENNKLFEAVQRANEIWDRATGRNQ
jgi:uncharacterized protein YqgV (UPF0045/DUF77 family)